jgi:hypothetical protein
MVIRPANSARPKRRKMTSARGAAIMQVAELRDEELQKVQASALAADATKSGRVGREPSPQEANAPGSGSDQWTVRLSVAACHPHPAARNPKILRRTTGRVRKRRQGRRAELDAGRGLKSFPDTKLLPDLTTRPRLSQSVQQGRESGELKEDDSGTKHTAKKIKYEIQFRRVRGGAESPSAKLIHFQTTYLVVIISSLPFASSLWRRK